MNLFIYVFLYIRKGYISTEDLKEVFKILGESITDEEVNLMIKIAGIKSNDKINFKEFVDFFYKLDWNIMFFQIICKINYYQEYMKCRYKIRCPQLIRLSILIQI